MVKKEIGIHGSGKMNIRLNSQQIYYCEALWTVNRPKCGTLGLGKENENLGEESKYTKEE